MSRILSMVSRRSSVVLGAGALVASALPGGLSLAAGGQKAAPKPHTVALLYVQTADSATTHRTKKGVTRLTLHDVQAQTIYFTDRPDRLSGHIPTSAFVSRWSVPGKNSFVADPPNAAIEGTNGTKPHTTVVELKHPRRHGRSLTYTVRIVKPSGGLAHYKQRHTPRLPTKLTDVTLFIDDAGGTTIGGCLIGPGAQCPGANLSKANLSNTNLKGANLSGANFTKANLTNANLVDANFVGADVSGANLNKASYASTKPGNTFYLWLNVITSASTICPEGWRANQQSCGWTNFGD